MMNDIEQNLLDFNNQLKSFGWEKLVLLYYLALVWEFYNIHPTKGCFVPFPTMKILE